MALFVVHSWSLIIWPILKIQKITDCRYSLMYVTTVFSTIDHKLNNVQQCIYKWQLLLVFMMFFIIWMCVMDSKSSTASVNISLNSGSYHKLTQLIVEDDRKYWHRIKKSKQLSLINTLLNIVKLVINCRKYGFTDAVLDFESITHIQIIKNIMKTSAPMIDS
jgi:short subunit fatty acids transporter